MPRIIVHVAEMRRCGNAEIVVVFTVVAGDAAGWGRLTPVTALQIGFLYFGQHHITAVIVFIYLLMPFIFFCDTFGCKLLGRF